MRGGCLGLTFFVAGLYVVPCPFGCLSSVLLAVLVLTCDGDLSGRFCQESIEIRLPSFSLSPTP